MTKLAPNQTHAYCERIWFQELENYINLILIFLLPTNHDFGRRKQHLFDILFFTDHKKKSSKIYLSEIISMLLLACLKLLACLLSRLYICNYKFARYLLSLLGCYTRVKKMMETFGTLSIIKKMYHQLYSGKDILGYNFTCSFEEGLWNVTHLMWVTFMLSKAG